MNLVALLTAGKGNIFENRRDTAILRMLIDTGIRLSEISGLGVDDPDFDADVAPPRQGPAGPRLPVRQADRGRAAPVSARPEPASDGCPGPARLWLGKKGPLTDSGIAQLLDRGAGDAGIGHIHPHLFRHGFAHACLAAGGQENDLMCLAGWRFRDMTGRYAASAADERAREAYRRLGLGDWL